MGDRFVLYMRLQGQEQKSQTPAADDVVSLFRNACLKRYDKGTVITGPSAEPNNLYYIIHGVIQLTGENIDGQEATVDLLMPGQIFGEQFLCDAQSIDFSAEVVSPEAKLLELSRQKVFQMLKEDPQSAKTLLKVLATSLQDIRRQAMELTVTPATLRVLNFILQFYQMDQMPFELPCKKTVIASYLGMKRETLSRVLQELHQAGVHVAGNIVTVQSLKRIHRLYPSNVLHVTAEIDDAMPTIYQLQEDPLSVA